MTVLGLHGPYINVVVYLFCFAYSGTLIPLHDEPWASCAITHTFISREGVYVCLPNSSLSSLSISSVVRVRSGSGSASLTALTIVGMSSVVNG